jgi:hypothetical protein
MKQYKLASYNETSYDQYWCLKPSPMLWIAIVYLSRSIMLPMLVGISSMTGAGDTASIVRSFVGLNALVASLVAFVVVFAYLRRSPSAGAAVRWIWSHGRLLLALAVILDLALGLSSAVRVTVEDGGQTAFLAGVAALLDLSVLSYVTMSRRVRDVFSDFPPPAS